MLALRLNSPNLISRNTVDGKNYLEYYTFCVCAALSTCLLILIVLIMIGPGRTHLRSNKGAIYIFHFKPHVSFGIVQDGV